MAKRRNKHKPARGAQSQNRRHQEPVKIQSTRSALPPLLTAATVLAVLGALLTAYLTAVRWFGQSAAYCAAGSGCDVVQGSRWSVLLGMPLSLWGFLMYVLLAALLWRQRRRPSVWPKVISLAAFGTGMSIYLTTISIFEIGATCVYCLTSFAIIASILGILIVLRPKNLQRFDWSTWSIKTIPGIAIILLVLHLHYSGLFDPAVGPEKAYLRALAEHLSTSDATFFGAYWCANCKEQKGHFEASTHRLPYVECTPNGQGGGVAAACVSNRIESYPTWIIAGRRYKGVLTPATLAQISGFKSPVSADRR